MRATKIPSLWRRTAPESSIWSREAGSKPFILAGWAVWTFRAAFFRLGADGALTVGIPFPLPPAACLDIAAGAILALDYHEAASRLGE